MIEPQRATVVVSVYRDVEALRAILYALARQSVTGFEVLISEDGEDPAMAALLREPQPLRMLHLTQPDDGFRKNRALNRAVRAAAGDQLLFIDGDCLPARRFVEMHLAYARPDAACGGRRAELGPGYSARLRRDPGFVAELERLSGWLRHLPAARRDGVKSYEFGLCAPWLQRLTGERPIRIVGSNFSLPRQLLEAVNGFDERYEGPGLGEDADLEVRLRKAGFTVRNVKFVTPNFHLHHPRSYTVSAANEALFAAARAASDPRAPVGLA